MRGLCGLELLLVQFTSLVHLGKNVFAFPFVREYSIKFALIVLLVLFNAGHAENLLVFGF